jgi:type I restriction enzyme M protein
MKSKQSSVPLQGKFAETIHKIGYRFSLGKVFDDFLTMTMCAVTPNLHTKKSYYEDEYLDTINNYKDSELRHEFPKALAYLIFEMEERLLDVGRGNDVLGDFFEQNISNGRNGQFFTPPNICEFMASIVGVDNPVEDQVQSKPFRILDPSCGSGRMLLTAHRQSKYPNEYYGIDIDRTCVKMTALNFFFNGMFGSEVMCANALSPVDFVISYRISMFPLGIFKIENKEESKLWNMHRNSFTKHEPKEKLSDKIVIDNTPFNERPKGGSSQLVLF